MTMRAPDTDLPIVFDNVGVAVGALTILDSLSLTFSSGAPSVLIGPNALALASDVPGVQHLAEFGVVFLMFAIGLEFNLPKLHSMRAMVFGLGLLQVVVTIGGTMAGNLFLRWFFGMMGWPWDLGWQGSLVLGSAMAMSSTAIVVKLMAERLELESEHGRRVIGVLLFQDLAVVPLLVLIPALGSSSDQLFTALSWALVKATVLVGLLLTGGQRLMRWWLTLVARRYPSFVYLAPNHTMDARIALTREGQILVLDQYDPERIQRFINR